MTGEEVRDRRLKERIPQGVLARFAGVTQTDVSNFENGKGKLKPEEIGELAKGLVVIPLMTYREVMNLEYSLGPETEKVLAGVG